VGQGQIVKLDVDSNVKIRVMMDHERQDVHALCLED
jgi:hypothetical protein